MKQLLWPLAMLGVLAGALAGCADIRGVPADFAPAAPDSRPRTFTVARELDIEFAVGRDRTLSQGSAWSMIGTIAQGDVYKPRDTIFTLERINVHEAYLVLSRGKVVGYYLPAEHSYVPESKPFDIPMQ